MTGIDLDLNMEQILDVQLWADFPGCIDTLVEKSASAAGTLRQAVSEVYTKTDISVYWSPAWEKAALYVRPELDQQEFDWCLEAITEKMGSDHVRQEPLTVDDLQDWWVKVAYSPTLLRRAGELLQFFPSKDIPGFGGRPIASTVASGVLGAGLGYGGGWLAEKLLPQSVKRNGRLRHWGAALGGAAGVGLGATPGLINKIDGRDFNDPTLWSGMPGDGWENDLVGSQYKDAAASFIDKQAFATLGGPSFAESPLIQTNELGQVVWGLKNPQTAAMAMGAMHGASQMPDPRARPGIVTPHQTGLFGMAMGAAGGGLKGYLTGFVVGKGLGLLTGMPQPTQNKLQQAGTALGVVNSLVPRLFN